MRRLAPSALLATVVWTAACSGPTVPPLDERQPYEWISALYAIPQAERLAPPVASRIHGYAGVALYEGLRHAEPGRESLGGRLQGLDPMPEPGEGEHDWPIVAAEAERRVLSGLMGDWALASSLVVIDTLAEAQVERRVSAGVSPETRDRSLEYGGRIAEVILRRVNSDGFRATRGRPYLPPEGEHVWVNTTRIEEYAPISMSAASQIVRSTNPSAALVPGAANARQLVLDRPKPGSARVREVNPTLALEPYWGELMTWGIETADACAPPAPHPYSTDPDSPFWDEVMAVYETSRELTPEQRTIALFWADNPGVTGTPPGHWVAIMRQMVTQLDLSPLDAAQMFAWTGVAMADAFISVWDEKYRSNVIRPVTVIRREIEPDWETVVVTPPFPEYTSGHSVVSGAAAQMLTELFGDVQFSDSTHVHVGLDPRPFSSFNEAAEEAAVSRLYGGIHYPMAIDHGVTQGRCVTRAVLERAAPHRPDEG